MAGIDAWRTREPRAEGPEYLLLDEAQFIGDWGTWVKHQVDFRKDGRIAFAGRPCRWLRPTRNPASAGGTRSG